MAKPIKIEILGDATGFQKAVDGVGGALGKLGTLAGTAGLALGGLAVGGVAAATKGLFDLGATFDDVYDGIRVGTGATGEALEDLQNSFRAVAKNSTSSMEDVGVAIADLNTRLGLTGKPLEDLTDQFLNLSKITETDLATNIDNITRVFGDWSVATADQAAVMDELYRASQASGVSLDDLTTTLVQFGAPLRNLGFSLQESEAMLALWNKTGVNTELVMSGLKAAVGKFGAEGKDAQKEIWKVVDAIEAMGPGADATALAIDVFGRKAGPDLVDSITGGKFAIDDMMAAITDGTDTINQAADDTADWAEQWQTIKNRIFLALEPVATRVFGVIGDGLDRIQPLFDEVAGGITAFQSAWNAADGDITSSGFPGLMERLANFLRQSLIPAMQDLAGSMQTMGEKVMPALVSGGEFILGVFGRMIKFARDNDTVMQGLKVTVLGLVVAIGALAVTVGVMTAAFTAMLGAIVIAVAGVVGAISRFFEWIKSNKDAWVQAIKAPFAEGLGWVERKWNDLKSTFTNPFGGLIGALPGRATGGSVSNAGMYRVNERGTSSIGGESIFLPSGSRVQPNYAGGSEGAVTYNIYAPNAGPAEVAREIAWRRRMGDGR